MNKYKKLVLLSTVCAISLFSHTRIYASQPAANVGNAVVALVTDDSKHTPLYRAIKDFVKQHPIMMATIVLTIFASRQYFEWKKRPKDDEISPEAKVRRWNEVVNLKNGYSTYKRLRLLISFIDDFYVFGRKVKLVDVKIKTKNADGSVKTVEDIEVAIKGTGLVSFINDKVLWKLEDLLKFTGVLAAAFITLDAILAGDATHLLKPADAKIK